jgi:NAD(P)-dependent dehydrogenase (short-subunit alcohol dehydrogenase family)
MNKVQTLTGKIALVTGASRGLGKAVALELAQAGAHVICTARSIRGHSTQSKLPATTIDDTVDSIHKAGGRAEAIMCDHTDIASVKALVEYIAKQYSRLDILVNNAWGGHDLHDESASGESVWDEPLDQFKHMLLAGAYSDYINQPHRAQISDGSHPKRHHSQHHLAHTPNHPCGYLMKASKAAKNRLVYTLGYHLKDKGIPVIAIAPGWMQTELMFTHHTMDELEGQTETPHYSAEGSPR